MTIQLIAPYTVAGSSQAAGSILSLSDTIEGDAINRGAAFPYYAPVGGYRALVVGDSITAQAEVILSGTSVTDNGDGTATVVRTSHGADVGERVRLHGTPRRNTNVIDAPIVERIDANSFKVALTGRRHNVTSSSTPSITFQIRRSFRGWLTWLEMLRGEAFQSTWAAVGGATIPQIRDLVESAGADHDIAFVMMGMNDIYSAGYDIATIKHNMVGLLTAVARRAPRVVVLTVPPRNSADAAWSSAKQIIHTALNHWLLKYARAQGFFAVDTWRATQNGATYVDASATNPDPLAAMIFDNTHPSGRGALAIANSVKPIVDALLPATAWYPAHKDQLGANIDNLFTDSDFATDSAGVATGWVVSDTTTNMAVAKSMESRTVADHGDAVGRNQLLTINYGTATGTASTRFRRNDVHSLLTPGKRCLLRIPFSVTDATGLVGLDLAMFGTTTSSFWQVYGPVQDTNADAVTGAFHGVLFTPIVTVPSNLTDVDVWVRPYLSSAQSSDMVLRLWHPQLLQFT